ncbi:MAG: RCC1 domain-containing protein, partial [Bdellovibrionota bacterium]
MVPAASTQSLTFANLGYAEPYLGWTCIGPIQNTLTLPSGQTSTAFYLSGNKPSTSTFEVGGGGLTAGTKSVSLKTKFQLEGGATSICMILASGRVKCLGDGAWSQHYNGAGVMVGDQLADMGSNLGAASIGTNRTALYLATAEENLYWTGSCVILDNHKLRCWGHPDVSSGQGNGAQVGNTGATIGDNLPYVNIGTNRLAYRITGGYAGYCIITDMGAVKCWGMQDTTSWVQMAGYGDTLTRGQTAGTMGDCLPDVNLGTGVVAADIECGKGQCCVITNDRRVKCWGNGNYGRTGYGDALTRGWGAGQMGDCLPYVNIGSNRTPIHVAGTNATTCVHLDTNEMRCFGYGAYGSLLSGGTTDIG